jgi:hypothetical protein
MRKYFKTTEKFEKAVDNFRLFGYDIEKKKVHCACGESTGAIVFKGPQHLLNDAEVLVKCECCYNKAKLSEKGE